MYLSTYFVNETRKEYIYMSIVNPDEISKNLIKIESLHMWDLRNDHIFICHTGREKLIKYKLLEV